MPDLDSLASKTRRARNHAKYVARKPLVLKQHKALTKLAEFARNIFTLSVIAIAGYSYYKRTGELAIGILALLSVVLLTFYSLKSFEAGGIWFADHVLKRSKVNGIGWATVASIACMWIGCGLFLYCFIKGMVALTGELDKLDLPTR